MGPSIYLTHVHMRVFLIIIICREMYVEDDVERWLDDKVRVER